MDMCVAPFSQVPLFAAQITDNGCEAHGQPVAALATARVESPTSPGFLPDCRRIVIM